MSAVKPLLSNKIVSNEKITIMEDNNVMDNDRKSCNSLEYFFLQLC